MTTDRHRVVIAGAGIAGLALGIRLRQLGQSPLIIERQKGIFPQIKGEYFQPQGVHILKALGLLEKFCHQSAVKVTKVSHQFANPITSNSTRLEVSYEERDGISFGLAIMHEDILRIMRQEYERLGGALFEGVAISGLSPMKRGTKITLETGEAIVADYFVGADGRHSPTRRMLGMSLRELPCNRVMMAAMVEGLSVPYHEFYTEELSGGILYAFQYPKDQTRVYLCFSAKELKDAASDRKAFFKRYFESSKLQGVKTAKVVGPIFMMPTADQMLRRRATERAIWFGDAAGTVDPLGGHGMSVALEDAMRIADTIADKKPNLEKVGRISSREYLHARFIGIWIGILMMGQSLPLRIAKWKAFREYKRDLRLQNYLVDLFSGRNRDPFSLIDVPYLLGWVPTRVRGALYELPFHKRLLGQQSNLLTALKPAATDTLKQFREFVSF